MKSIILAFIAAITLIGCSGHPAATAWELAPGYTYSVDSLAIDFEGKAVLTQTGKEQGSYHCFWTAKSAQVITLQCRLADEDDTDYHFELMVDQLGVAQLLADDKLLAKYQQSDQ